MKPTLQGVKNHIDYIISHRKRIHKDVKELFPLGETILFKRAEREAEGVVVGYGSWWGRCEYLYAKCEETGRTHSVYIPDLPTISSTSSSE